MSDNLFPVTYSTLESSALVNRVLTQYEIEVIENCQFWNRGLSDVYLVETQGEPYILRVSHHHWRSRSDIQFELELLDFLREHHLPIAYPLRTAGGELFVTINAPEGERYAALFTYAPGQIPVGDLNLKQSWKLGETLAKVHDTALEFRCPAPRQALTLEYLLDDSFDAIAPFLRERPKDLGYLQGAIAKLKLQLQAMPIVPPFWGICWGDPHSGNAHFTSDNRVSLFDFDQCGYGWRAFDVGKFLQVSARAGLSKSVREAFITGYQSVQPLTELEITALRAFTQTAHIWVWSININMAIVHNWCRLDDHYFRQRLEQLKRLASPDWQLF